MVHRPRRGDRMFLGRYENVFLNRYQDYCRSRDQREEIFRMAQKEDEIVEDFNEHFQYNLQRSKHSNLEKDVLKMILLRAIKDDFLNMLNMMGRWDISKDSYDDIIQIFLRCSRGFMKNGAGMQDVFSRVQKSTNGGAIRVKIGNLFGNFNTDIISSLSSQWDLLQEK